MQVRELMSSPVITVLPATKIREVARIMRQHQFNGVPVVDGAGALLGVVTELDMLRRNAPVHQPRYIAVLSAYIPVGWEEHRKYKEQLRDSLAITAEDLMTEDVATIEPSAPVEDALELMLDPKCTMLPVIEAERLVGVITRTDLVRLIEELEIGREGASEEATGT